MPLAHPSAQPIFHYGFSKSVEPAVTAGAYSAGDIMGGLLTFTDLAPGEGMSFVLDTVEVALKADVAPALTLILFDRVPLGTTQTDNAAYSLAVADAFKVIAVLPFTVLGAYTVDHGTPATVTLAGLARVLKAADDRRTIYGLLVDGTGVTLASVADLKVTLSGSGL
jgi:hypothetical protein